MSTLFYLLFEQSAELLTMVCTASTLPAPPGPCIAVPLSSMLLDANDVFRDNRF
jgi:hypothetical protein